MISNVTSEAIQLTLSHMDHYANNVDVLESMIGVTDGEELHQLMLAALRRHTVKLTPSMFTDAVNRNEWCHDFLLESLITLLPTDGKSSVLDNDAVVRDSFALAGVKAIQGSLLASIRRYANYDLVNDVKPKKSIIRRFGKKT